MKTLPAKCHCAGVPTFYCPDCGSPGITEPPGYAARVRELEAEGLTTSDAQGVADVEFREPRPTTTCLHCGEEFHDRSMITLDDGGELCYNCLDTLRDAAPDLLAALRLCVTDLQSINDAMAWENGNSYGRTIDQALTAIAKATS